ncbi:GAF and ANTAR domain-containing protein [Rathayibacter sp. VKM Ac-2754]|uniref:GAF and ANTAR domain-containing protein n=1 Tax=Rathayibacter sp. VKM Ac-2754 TaxID=2609251 RepID=UPI00135A764D|nr:GAF and ANTAR domain-containing protein [Rathayibacter sp. VKM Ac-2754]MWV58547.1 GAF domain-containing protein [Rathayibacter sp. VKM Ac-2754]
MIGELTPAPGGGHERDLDSLLTSFVTLLPVEDAAASALGRPFDIETLVASSSRAAGLDGAQIDLGEGPSWNAYRTLRPVSMRVDHDRELWPFFASTLTRVGVCSVLAVPLLVGTLSIGAVSLYSDSAVMLEAEQLRLAANLSTLLARSVVARALDEADSGVAVRDPSLSRREVHQATGMVIAQTGSTPEEALLTIRVHAYTAGLSVREVAARIVERRLDFSPDRGGPDHGTPDRGGPDHGTPDRGGTDPKVG